MLFLIVGLGSIGQRHVRNLQALLGSDAHFIAFRNRGLQSVISDAGRSDANVEQVYAIRTYTDLDSALAQQPLAAFVCNPTSLHVPVALAVARSGCHLFIEKPVSHTMDGLIELQSLARDRGLRVMIGFQYRFHPGLVAVKELVNRGAVGDITNVRVNWGEYLPSWHPWEDHRHSYSARKDLGGGVILTLCHPFDYLRWIFGEMRSVYAAIGRLGSLNIDVEDTADITVQFESGIIGSVHLDYVQRPACHNLKVIGQSGTILWDNESGAVQYYRADHGEWERISPPPSFTRNDLFLDETRHFLGCISEQIEPLVSLQDGIRALQIALAAKRSATDGRLVELGR